MANLTNKDLTVLCTSTASNQYIKSVSVASTPLVAGGGLLGKAGDFFQVGARSYFKTGDASTSWVGFNANTV